MSSQPQLRVLVRPGQADIDETFYAAQGAYQRTIAFFQDNARYIQFRRVLGFGSSGIVTLWTETMQPGHHGRDIAVKVPVDEDDPYFRMEMNWMSETFATSEHFVQLHDLPDQALDASLYNDPDPEAPAIMIMEYFERCELQELLVRLNEAVSNNAYLPDNQKRLEFIPARILWRLFLCLTRMCIGMAYPPQFDYDYPPIQRENIRPGEAPRLIVHFDLHPLNIFIDNTHDTFNDFPEHGWAPRFKLGDFGLTTEWDEEWTDEEKWAVVSAGKPGYQAPEQRDRQRPLQPGAIGPHTNIWGIGFLMFNALTFYFTDDDEWQPRRCNIRMPDGTAKNLNTWAPFLVGSQVYDEFKIHSIELRTLIARCMADNHRDRPSLDELLAIIQQNIANVDAAGWNAQQRWQQEKAVDPTKQKPPIDVKRPPAAEDDDLLRRFFREYLRDPPVRDDPYRDYWNEQT
ncbi:kinase-like domain-containing protein [Hypoxylon sp. NC1633]|nr:kinase-like domain-containing protein [Hypoxylon sp. NC1633]